MIHEHTRSLIRFIRLTAPPGGLRRRGGRLPPQAHPDEQATAYHQALCTHVCKPAEEAAAHARTEILAMLIRERRDRMDMVRATGGLAVAQHLVEEARRRFVDVFRPHEVHQVAMQFGRRVGEHQKRELDKQVRHALGVSFESIEKPIRDRVPGWAAENVQLVKTVPERYFDRLSSDVQEAFTSGMHPETLAESFVDRYDMSENDAERLARDQIGKLNAAFNQDRQQALGLTEYFWRGVRDGRERDSHVELEGARCKWDDPPDGGGTDEDEAGNPGDGIQCRCFAEPIFDPLLDGNDDNS